MAYARRGDMDGTGPYAGSYRRQVEGYSTGRRGAVCNPGMSDVPGVTSLAWTAFKIALTYAVVHVLWLGGKK